MLYGMEQNTHPIMVIACMVLFIILVAGSWFITFGGYLTIGLYLAKITGEFTHSWWYVIIPLAAPLGAVLGLCVFVCVVAYVFYLGIN